MIGVTPAPPVREAAANEKAVLGGAPGTGPSCSHCGLGAAMFAQPWLLLPGLPEYRTGLIMVGPACHIATVPLWNDQACRDVRRCW